MAEGFVRQFISNNYSDIVSDESIYNDWKEVDPNAVETWNEENMVDPAITDGTNATIVMSLFLHTGCFMVDSKDADDQTPFYTCCQPAFNSKQFHTPHDLQSYSSNNKDSTQLPVCAVVYKASAKSEKNQKNVLVPMIFPASGTRSFEEVLGTDNLNAEKVRKKDLGDAFQLLFPNTTIPLIFERKSRFKTLFQYMCQAFDLTTQQGWVKLLKKLLSDEEQVAEVPAYVSTQTLTLVTSLVFGYKININLAFLVGEEPILAMKQKLLSAESPFPLLSGCQISSSLKLLEEDFGLDQAKLKQCSFHRRSLLAKSSETGSFKDLLMENSLRIIKKGSSVFDEVGKDTDPATYDNLQKSTHKEALEALLAAKEYNPHVRTILEAYKDKKEREMAPIPVGLEEEDLWADFLARMFKARFRPVTNSMVPKELSWIINMMTQFDNPSCALALFSLLCKDQEHQLLPHAHANCSPNFTVPYVRLWDSFFKARLNIASTICSIYEASHKTMKPSKKSFVDFVARRVSSVLLNIMEQHSTTWSIPEERKTGHPKLVSALSKDASWCTIVELIFKAATTKRFACIISLGSALTNIRKPYADFSKTEFIKAVETGELLSYNGEEKDLLFFVGAIASDTGSGEAVGMLLDALEAYLDFHMQQQAERKLAKEARVAKPMSRKESKKKKKREERKLVKAGAAMFVVGQAKAPRGDDDEDDDEDDDSGDDSDAVSDTNKDAGSIQTPRQHGLVNTDSEEEPSGGTAGNRKIKRLEKLLLEREVAIRACKRKFNEQLQEKDEELAALKENNERADETENKLIASEKKCDELLKRGREKNVKLKEQRELVEDLKARVEDLKARVKKLSGGRALNDVTNTPKETTASKKQQNKDLSNKRQRRNNIQ